MHRWTAIFFVTIRISIFEWDIAVSQNNKIFVIKTKKITLPTFRNYCFNQFYDSLPKYKPFFSHRASSLLSIASSASNDVFFTTLQLHAALNVSFWNGWYRFWAWRLSLFLWALRPAVAENVLATFGFICFEKGEIFWTGVYLFLECFFISGVEFFTVNNRKMHTFDLLIVKGDTLRLLMVKCVSTINNHWSYDY